MSLPYFRLILKRIRNNILIFTQDFVEVCLKAGDLNEAKKYLPKVKEDEQIKYYILAG